MGEQTDKDCGPADAVLRKCCGCSCDVCAEGHNTGASRHTNAWGMRFYAWFADSFPRRERDPIHIEDHYNGEEV